MEPTATNAASTQSIVVEYDLPQSPAKVWQALTDPELLTAWLMPNNIRPEVGHLFTFQTQPAPGFDGVVNCQVLVVEPQHKLSYSWRGGSQEKEGYGHYLNTTVTWTLVATPSGGTHLHLDHAGFTPEDSFAFQAMGKGWRGNVATSMARALDETA